MKNTYRKNTGMFTKRPAVEERKKGISIFIMQSIILIGFYHDIGMLPLACFHDRNASSSSEITFIQLDITFHPCLESSH